MAFQNQECLSQSHPSREKKREPIDYLAWVTSFVIAGVLGRLTLRVVENGSYGHNLPWDRLIFGLEVHACGMSLPECLFEACLAGVLSRLEGRTVSSEGDCSSGRNQGRVNGDTAKSLGKETATGEPCRRPRARAVAHWLAIQVS